MEDPEILVAEVNLTELACLIMEAFANNKRPPGATAKAFLTTIKRVEPSCYERYMRAAEAAAYYMAATLQQAINEHDGRGKPN